MFSYAARIDPTDDSHVVCTHLMGLFYGTDVKVEMMDETVTIEECECNWILVSLTGTEDECTQLSKKLRRLARGKPRFTITRSSLSQIGETPADRLKELIGTYNDFLHD